MRRQPVLCDSKGCENFAVWAIKFRDQPGHVHDCNQHTALLREFCDIAESHLLPCRFTHNGTQWVDRPKELS